MTEEIRTLQVSKHTHHKVKLQAFKEGITIKELIKDMVAQRIKNKKK